MGLFGSKEGGFMDVIRCDEEEYLMWKWSPAGYTSKKENAIRYGSSLRVKEGEVAVFVYKQQDGAMQDFIEGPYDQTIKTANFPVLTSIVGAAFGGSSPFQAEIYFINLATNNTVTFFIPEVEVSDPRYPDILIPVSVKGVLLFSITDYRTFIKAHRLRHMELEELIDKIKDFAESYINEIIVNAPAQMQVSVLQIAKSMSEVNRIIKGELFDLLNTKFGISLDQVRISRFDIDKECDDYQKLKMQESFEMDTRNENMAETLRIQREEAQRAQKLQTESNFLSAHQINVQGDVAMTAAESLGQMGASGAMSMGGGMGGGMNPGGMMAGMMMGTAVGGGMANMMGNVMQGMNQPQPPTPPAGTLASYMISVNGQQSGPYTVAQLQAFAQQGSFTPSTYVWKQGMGAWESAGNIPELAALFAATPPPPPPPPPGL